METKTYTVYKFDELSEKAKERALDEFRQDSTQGEWAWDSTQEDAIQAGLKLAGTHRNRMEGDFIKSALACASFIIENHGKKCETYKTAKAYIKDLKSKNDFCREEAESSFLRDILEDYRIMSEKNQEYAYSDESIIETIEANDYDFLENGKLD